MSWLPDIFTDSTNQQTDAEAQANLAKLQGQYKAQLDKRLANGEVSQQFYNEQSGLLQETLQDPSDAGWTEFNATVVQEAKDLPATVQNAITDTATWVGSTVGKTTSGLGGGLFGGLVSNFKFVIGVIVIGFLSWLLWKPLLKPLLDKILIIPV